MKNIKKKLLFLSLTILLFTHTRLIACAGGYSEIYIEDEDYNFIDASMVHLDKENPLYKLSSSYSAHEDRLAYFNKKKKELNIKAWEAYFKGYFSKEKIESLFYKKGSIARSSKKYKSSSKFPHFSHYISFLEQQNNFAQNKDSSLQFKEIIKKGEKLLKKETTPFLKERYLYLLLRLYHHKGKYKETIELYEKYASIIEKKSLVKEWIDALRAGAYKHLKQSTKANQIYAQIFKNNQSNAFYGYYDFKIKTNREWRKLLRSTSHKETKALYHFLRAMQWENEPLHELNFIATIAPKSVWFERLSFMIMQDFQNQRYAIMKHSGKKDKYLKSQIKSYKIQTKKFLAIIKKLKNPSFFALYSKLYLKTLEYSVPKKSEIKKLRKLAKKSDKVYVHLLRYLIKLHALNDIDEISQNNLFQKLPMLLSQFDKKRQTSLLRYTALQLATLYPEKSVDTSFSRLYAKNKYLKRSDILKKINYKKATSVQKYIEKKQRSFVEKKVFKASMKALKKNDIAKILTTLYLKENNFTQAKFYLRQIPRENLFSPYNPFNATLNGTNRTLSKTTYTQRSFIETMLRLKYKLVKKPKSAMDHFLYANGLYNKSWFGNFPMSATLYRPKSLYKDDILPDTLNLDKAEKHYKLAFKYAKTENFKAKIAYQLLKIEFNRVLSNTQNYHENLWSMPNIGGWNDGTKNVMKLLKQSKKFQHLIEDYYFEYDLTPYGEYVIENCITFKYFQ